MTQFFARFFSLATCFVLLALVVACSQDSSKPFDPRGIRSAVVHDGLCITPTSHRATKAFQNVSAEIDGIKLGTLLSRANYNPEEPTIRKGGFLVVATMADGSQVRLCVGHGHVVEVEGHSGSYSFFEEPLRDEWRHFYGEEILIQSLVPAREALKLVDLQP